MLGAQEIIVIIHFIHNSLIFGMAFTKIASGRKRRHARVRAKIKGSQQTPRFSVFVSNKHFYAQLIDDEQGRTLASSSDRKIEGNAKKSSEERARFVGADIAEKAQKEKKIKKVVFDRGGRKYAGNIKILADSARESGLEF